MNAFRRHGVLLALLTALIAGAFFVHARIKERALHTLPYGFQKFSLFAPLPVCGRWKEHMPATRDPAAFHLYIEARKVWRSKIEWQLTREEATRILTDVSKAADMGDWGARALMAYFYREGLGPLDSNRVLVPDLNKAVEITRMAVVAGQPWGLYDFGVAYEYGYGDVPYDLDLAWAYYLKAAQLGSPEAQMALAGAYRKARRFEDEETMLRCAYMQGHGAAAFELGMGERVDHNYASALQLFQHGVQYGNQDSASTLYLLFGHGRWSGSSEQEVEALRGLGITRDEERAKRYNAIHAALEINPDLKLTRLDSVLPLPPAPLPDWSGVEDALEIESTEPPSY